MSYIHIEIFTVDHIVRGLVNTDGERLTDVLNKRTISSVVLKDVEIVRLARVGKEAPLRLDNACIEKNAILFAKPVEQDLTQKSMFRKTTRQLFQITVLINNFELRGRIHLAERLNISKILLLRPEDFIPITDARASYVWNPAISFPSDMIVFNKTKVTLLGENYPKPPEAK